jgi:tetrapyrrole methylase family protein / MazG family protein
MSETTPFEKLVEVMTRLRAPGGCPWDLKQTHESIIPYLIEEAHEAQEALATQDWDEFKDEMGDILCQVVFHGLIAQESDRFNLDDICQSITEKLIRRHPHVFGDTKISGTDEVLKNWETIKKAERAKKHPQGVENSLFATIPKTLPALMRSTRLLQKAERLEVDTTSIEEAKEQVIKKVTPLTQMTKNEAPEQSELGELLFSLVKLARHLKLDPEAALLETTRKYQKQFETVEKKP